MDDATRSALDAATREIVPHLEWLFSQPVAAVIVDQPRPGLVLRLNDWPAPPGRVLDVFVGAQAEGGSDDAVGLLEQQGEEDAERTASASELILFHFQERLGTGDFPRRWSEGPNGHLWVSLYG